MPIYEFRCPACGERFDRLQKLSDPDPDSCPNCGATGVRRQVTAPAFRLAGSGWYETDFKKDGDRKRNLADKKEAPTEGKTADSATKSEAPAKPEKKLRTQTRKLPKWKNPRHGPPASAANSPERRPSAMPAIGPQSVHSHSPIC